MLNVDSFESILTVQYCVCIFGSRSRGHGKKNERGRGEGREGGRGGRDLVCMDQEKDK
jgi:hypothetical protein